MSEFVGDTTALVVLTLNDTIHRTYLPICNLYRYVASRYYGVSLSNETILEHWGETLRDHARVYFQTTDIESLVDHLVDHADDFPRGRIPHAAEAVRALRAAGKMVALVTNIPDATLAVDAQRAGLPLAQFDLIHTVDAGEAGEPSSVLAPVLAWAAERCIEHTAIVSIGDDLASCGDAREAGVRFLGICTGRTPAEEFDSVGVASIPDLGRLVGENNQPY